MKNRFKKFLMLSAAAVLLAGTVSNVAYAHSNHHKSRKTTAACYTACYQDGICMQYGNCELNGAFQNDSCTQNGNCELNGVCQNGGCTQNGSCEVNGVCQNGGYCTGTPCYQDGAICNGSHYTEHHTGTWSGHHSERGHGFHH